MRKSRRSFLTSPLIPRASDSTACIWVCVHTQAYGYWRDWISLYYSRHTLGGVYPQAGWVAGWTDGVTRQFGSIIVRTLVEDQLTWLILTNRSEDLKKKKNSWRAGWGEAAQSRQVEVIHVSLCDKPLCYDKNRKQIEKNHAAEFRPSEQQLLLETHKDVKHKIWKKYGHCD